MSCEKRVITRTVMSYGCPSIINNPLLYINRQRYEYNAVFIRREPYGAVRCDLPTP